MFEQFLPECGVLLHQVPTVPSQQLELDVVGMRFMFQQAESIDGSAVNRGEIGVIGLVSGIGGLAVLLGRVRVDDTDLDPSLGERALNGAVITPGSLDDADEVFDIVSCHCGADVLESGLKARAVVLDGGRLQKDPAVEVREQDLGACLGAVHAKEREVFGPNSLDTWMDDAPRLM
jgi:hypothetical protein